MWPFKPKPVPTMTRCGTLSVEQRERLIEQLERASKDERLPPETRQARAKRADQMRQIQAKHR
jgi:hypothetical protein